MASQKGGSKDKGDNGDSNGGIALEVETTRRLKIQSFSFEEILINGRGGISLSGPGIENRPLSEEEISAFVRFFVGFQRRQDRGDDIVQDGRGQVTDASTDARLKGNEDQRPHDPTRDKQAGKT